MGKSLGKQLFTARLELIAELDKVVEAGNTTIKAPQASDSDLRHQVANLLHTEVAAMNSENFARATQATTGREIC